MPLLAVDRLIEQDSDRIAFQEFDCGGLWRLLLQQLPDFLPHSPGRGSHLLAEIEVREGCHAISS